MRTDWVRSEGHYTSRDGRVKVSRQRDSAGVVRCWTVEVDGKYVGWQKRLDNAKQLGVESRDGIG
jgi:hypothetical protein